MHASRRFLQLDVFADRPGAGNALAVVLDSNELDDQAMQAFACWTNLSETTFLLPPTTPAASYRVRIFTPRQELPFAGHPSVGSAHAALESGLVTAQDGRLVQECAAGLLPIRLQGEGVARRIFVRAPKGREVAMAFDSRLMDAALAGINPGALPACIIDNGPRWLLVEHWVEASGDVAVETLRSLLTLDATPWRLPTDPIVVRIATPLSPPGALERDEAQARLRRFRASLEPVIESLVKEMER